MLSKTWIVTGEKSCHCWSIFDPEVIDDPFHEEHVEDDREKTERFTEKVLDGINAMIFLLNVLHVAYEVLALFRPFIHHHGNI